MLSESFYFQRVNFIVNLLYTLGFSKTKQQQLHL